MIRARQSTKHRTSADCWTSDKLTGPERYASKGRPQGKVNRPRGLRWGEIKHIRDALRGAIR